MTASNMTASFRNKMRLGSSGHHGSSFKNVKFVDETEHTRCSVRSLQGNDKENNDSGEYQAHHKQCGNPLGRLFGRLTAEERLQRSERYEENELNRSEHDEISRPWQHRARPRQERQFSFRNVRYIDEKDERRYHKTINRQPFGGVDHIAGEEQDNVYCSTHTSTNASSYRPRRPHHETMLEVMRRLEDEEHGQTIPMNGTTTTTEKEQDYNKRYYLRKEEQPTSMLKVMEMLMGGPDSMKVVDRSSAPVTFRKITSSSSKKPLQPAIRLGFNAKSA